MKKQEFFGALAGNLGLKMGIMSEQISYYIIANIKLCYFKYVKLMSLICHPLQADLSWTSVPFS